MLFALLLSVFTPFTGVAGVFGYDAVEATPRRKAPRLELRSEDDLLLHQQRDKLVSSARDAQRNYELAAWMIRKHLDFVADFTFQANTPDRDFNRRLEAFVDRWSKRDNCHVAGRHPLRRLLRMAECCRTVDGDLLWEKLRDGTLNLIRGDRVRNPGYLQNTDDWKHGINVDLKTGRPRAYQVWKRTRWGRFEIDKLLPAGNALHHGYFTDPEQVRGVSPMSTAINRLRDGYEAKDFAAARMKAEMILGVAITSDGESTGNPWQGNRQYEPGPDGETSEAKQSRIDDENQKGKVSFGPGLFIWEMRPGEKVSPVSGNMPSSNAQQFINLCIHVALKSLDIPFSFYSEDFTNFYGSRGALQLYKRSAQNKQQDNADLLDELSLWRFRQAVIDNQLQLPRGWRIDELDFCWVPRGIPWWDRSKEIRGDLLAIAAGLDTPQGVCLEHGTGDYESNVDAIAKAVRYWNDQLGDLNVPISFTAPPETVAVSEATQGGSGS